MYLFIFYVGNCIVYGRKINVGQLSFPVGTRLPTVGRYLLTYVEQIRSEQKRDRYIMIHQ